MITFVDNGNDLSKTSLRQSERSAHNVNARCPCGVNGQSFTDRDGIGIRFSVQSDAVALRIDFRRNESDRAPINIQPTAVCSRVYEKIQICSFKGSAALSSASLRSRTVHAHGIAFDHTGKSFVRIIGKSRKIDRKRTLCIQRSVFYKYAVERILGKICPLAKDVVCVDSRIDSRFAVKS